MDNQKKVWYLQRVDLLSSLTDDEIEDIARLLGDHHMSANVELLGDRQHDRIYIIKEGAVRLHSGGSRDQVTLALLGRGKTFGLSSTVGDDDQVIYATTLVPSYVCFASWSKMMEVFNRYPQVMVKMMAALADQLFRAEAWRARFGISSPRRRLAHLLIELSDEFGAQTEVGRVVQFRLTQTDLGRMIGLSRETVSRLMAEFDRLGWVGREKGLLVVRDHHALAACRDTDAV